MTTQPLVSVLMTAYNREKYIAEAIESVLASTYTNWELIIVDDCSQDKTLEIAKSYEAKDSRIKVYKNEQNLGDYPNRNKAASYAKGKYIKYLDSDDIIYPHGLELMVRAMEQFPDAAMGLTFNNYEEKSLLPISFTPENSLIFHFSYKGLLYIGPSGSIYKKEYFDNVGGFNPKFKVASDYHFNLRAAAQNSIVLFHRDLVWWRQHEGQEIINSNRNNEYIIFNYQIHKQIIPLANIDNTIKNKILYNNEILMARRLLKMIPRCNFSRISKILKETKFPIKYFLKVFLPTYNI